ncbi:hypothetical protein C6Q12_17225 [Burkholderia multivorans]|nr:hypothetical protein C6Q12_17225 [Burkholderia multivorans]
MSAWFGLILQFSFEAAKSITCCLIFLTASARLRKVFPATRLQAYSATRSDRSRFARPPLMEGCSSPKMFKPSRDSAALKQYAALIAGSTAPDGLL